MSSATPAAPRVYRVQVVRTPGPDRLRVGVGELGFRDQDFVRHRPHRPDLAFLAGQHLAPRGDLQPFTNVAILPDAFPDLGGRPVHVDLQRDRRVGWFVHHDVDGGRRCCRHGGRGRRRLSARRDKQRQRHRGAGGCGPADVIRHDLSYDGQRTNVDTTPSATSAERKARCGARPGNQAPMRQGTFKIRRRGSATDPTR